MQAQVSVIIPVYNAEPFFERCLRSLFEQTLESIEYLFVNDCTPDGCVPLLEHVLDEYPHRKEQVHIIHHEQNRGAGASRKEGMKAATGEYVIHCDADDWVEFTMYERMYHKAVEEDADIVSCGFYEEGNNGQLVKIPERGEDKELMRKRKWNVLYSSLWSKLVRRSLYVDWDIYPYEGVNYWEDLGVVTRLRFLSRKTVILYEPLYHYNHRNNNSITRDTKAYTNFFLTEQIKCVKELESFFRAHDAYEHYSLLFQDIKFSAKLTLLRNGYYQEWLDLFPETHRYIWKLEGSFTSRLKYFLAAHKIFFFCEIRRRRENRRRKKNTK
jgi:glycosyltransferase involved in cell wall biosynthesis